MAQPILVKLLLAAATGLVIGFERGWSGRGAEPGLRAAGVRTFGLVALAGGICGVLPGGTVLLAVIVAAIAVLAGIAYVLGQRHHTDFGMTTEMALLVTPLLGMLAVSQPLDAIAVATLIAALLGFKQELHQVIERLGRDELLASVQLLIVAVAILPLLPDVAMGPWESINPRTIGLLVLMLLLISYVGYFAVRILGPGRGLLLTAFLGGLVSSTAVTLTYARLSRKAGQPVQLLAAGIALSCATMAPRIWIVVSAIQPDLAARLAPPLLALGLVPLAYALLAARGGGGVPAGGQPPMSNPLAIRAALALAALVTALTIAVRAAHEWFGDSGALVLAGLSGTVDVDAISLAMAQGAGRAIAPATAVLGILVAAVTNTVVKAGMTLVVGNPALGRRCTLVLGGGGALAIALGILAPRWMDP